MSQQQQPRRDVPPLGTSPLASGLIGSVQQLGAFAAGLRWDQVPAAVRARLALTLVDTAGVTAAGARTGEVAALIRAWDNPPGPARLLGTGASTTVDAAVWLNGTAACSLELDEGNKYARGHPAAHVVPVALAVAQAVKAPGSELLSALLAGHEVAARFGRALQPTAGLHTHGHWGAAGAAAAAARLLGMDGEGIAAAVDAACGLVLATHFDVALRGTFVRNTWIGAANLNGLAGARLAAAGLASVDGTAELTLGTLLGRLDAARLTEDLGQRYDVLHGYFKRHASCSYTHPPADAVLDLRRRHAELRAEDVVSIDVATHRLAAPLNGTAFPTRLAAMFSVPYVVALALVDGSCQPAGFDRAHRQDAGIRRLVEVTHVRIDEALDARLPAERPARVTLVLRDGTTLFGEVPNPVGDADYEPFDQPAVTEKLRSLLGAEETRVLFDLVDELPGAADSSELLAALP